MPQHWDRTAWLNRSAEVGALSMWEAVSERVFRLVSRSRASSPISLSPGRFWILVSQPIVMETVAVRVWIQP